MAVGAQGVGFNNSQTIVANRVILVGAGDALLVYTPSEGPGNLAYSISPAPFTDKFGNPVLQGETSYEPFDNSFYIRTFANLLRFGDLNIPGDPEGTIGWEASGNLQLTSGGAGDSAVIALVSMTGVNPQILLDGTGASGEVDTILNGGLYGEVTPGLPSSRVWVNFTPSPGFNQTTGFAVSSYQKEPIAGGRLRLRGVLTLTANQAPTTVITVLPPQLIPAFTQRFATWNTLTGYTAGEATIAVNSITGQVQLFTGGNTGDTVSLDGIVLELD